MYGISVSNNQNVDSDSCFSNIGAVYYVVHPFSIHTICFCVSRICEQMDYLQTPHQRKIDLINCKKEIVAY